MKKKIIKLYRSITITLMFVLFGFGALFIRYFIFPFHKNTKQHYKILQNSWIFFIFLMKKTNLISVNAGDIERLKNIKSSIIVSTHPSFIDIVILMSIIPNSTCFVAERLARNPFLKGIASHLFILEGQEIDKWAKDATNALNEGLNVIIFPMGIRHRKNEKPRIRRGAALIALASKKNIIILHTENSYEFLQINQPFYEAGDRCCEYNIKYLGEINIKELLATYPDDEVTAKTEITKTIKKSLYKN